MTRPIIKTGARKPVDTVFGGHVLAAASPTLKTEFQKIDAAATVNAKKVTDLATIAEFADKLVLGRVPKPSALQVFPDVEQRSPEWFDQRRGIVTASVMHLLLTATLKVAANDGSRGLTATLAAERITGYTEPTHLSPDMLRGILDEPFARQKYSEHHAQVTETGFMVRDYDKFKIGYSPDGLVGNDGLIEIKSRLQKKHLQTILADAVPAENMAQIQTGLLVSGRKWCDYVSYCGGMPLWTKRVTPDANWQTMIIEAVETAEQNMGAHIATYTAAVEGLPPTERIDHYDSEIVI